MLARINMRGSEITGRTTQDFITEARHGEEDSDSMETTKRKCFTESVLV